MPKPTVQITRRFFRTRPLIFSLLALLCAPLLRAQEPVVRLLAMPTSQEMQAEAGTSEGLAIDKQFYAQWEFLRNRAVDQDKATVLILELTTPGGELGLTDQIIKDLARLRDRGIRTVAYVPDVAMSAGALIAIGTQELVLAPGARTGNAIVIQFSDLGRISQDIPDKTRSQVMGLAERLAAGGRFDRRLILSMIDPELEIFSVRGVGGGDPVIQTKDELERNYPRDRIAREGQTVRQIVAKGQAYVLAADAERDRLLLGSTFPYAIANQRSDLLRVLGIADRDLKEDEVLRFDIPKPFGLGLTQFFSGFSFTWLLLLAGIIFFVMELQAPGIGLPGVLSVLSLVAFFAVESGDSSPWLPIALLLLGALLLFAELFLIPGFGLAGVSGLILIIGSIYAATIELPGESWTDQLIPDSSADWAQFKGWMLGFVMSFAGGGIFALAFSRVMDKVPFLKGAFIKPPVLEPASALAGPTAVTATGTVKLALGELGTSLTDLRPSGFARFGNNDIDVQSEGGWIAKGTAVRVLRIEGPRVFVGPVQEPTA